MKTVIMAGGKGTRIASVNSEVPKPMLPIMGKPILEYQIEALRRQGFTDIVLVIGHLGHIIRNYFGDGIGISPQSGLPFGVHISYIEEKVPLGTAGALYLLQDELLASGGEREDFLLINGDVIFDINLDRFYQNHKSNNGLVTIFTHPNNHPYDSSIIVSDENGCVKKWLNKEDQRLWYQNKVNAGIHFISNGIFDPSAGLFSELKKTDLDRDILKPLVLSGQLFAYTSPEYVMDMGTPERFRIVADDLARGKVHARNLLNKQKAIFLDRDGTINRHIGFLNNIDDFVLIPGVTDAIRSINQSGFLAIVVTNQPVVARGEVTLEELKHIHDKMETLLGEEGAYLDGIYVCPHHPHKGYSGECAEFKIVCNCRKPKPGLLLQAAKDFNINLKESWMVGDSEIDMAAGRAAGCHTIQVGTCAYRNLEEAINYILIDSGRRGKDGVEPRDTFKSDDKQVSTTS